MMTAHSKPMTHARIVDTGILGSSVLATADRTSGYGESSSTMRAQVMDFRADRDATHLEYPHPHHN